MPTYEYECTSCGHGFETFQSMNDKPLKNCPECGKEVRRIIFGGAGVIYKGSGFYVTDKSKSSKTETKSGETKTKSETSAPASPCADCPNKGASATQCPA